MYFELLRTVRGPGAPRVFKKRTAKKKALELMLLRFLMSDFPLDELFECL